MPKAPRRPEGATIPPVEQTMAGGPPPTHQAPADANDPWTTAGISEDAQADGWPAGDPSADEGSGRSFAEANPGVDPTADAGSPAAETHAGGENTPEPSEAAGTPSEGTDGATPPSLEGAGAADPDPEPNAGAGQGGSAAAEEAPKAGRKPRPSRAKPTPVQATVDPTIAEATHDGGFQLAALSSLDEHTEKVNAMWYGPEGTGKTTDVLTAANHGRVLVVNAEGGLKTTPLKARGIDVANVVPFPPAGRPELLTIDNLEALFWQVKAQLDEDPDSWYAVVWDSVTEIVNTLLTRIVAAEFEKNKTAQVKKEHRADPYFVDRSDYGTVGQQMLRLLRLFRDLDCHFLVTALERRDVDEDSGKVMYGPAATPAVANNLLGYLDVIVRVRNNNETGVGEPVFVAATRPASMTRAKDRFGVTPPIMEDPTFTRLLGYIEGDEVYTPPPPGETPVLPAADPAKPASGKRTRPTKAAAPAVQPTH